MGETIPPTTEEIVKQRSDNQIISRILIERDPGTGQRLRSSETSWTYYPTGEIDIIEIIDKDAVENVTVRKTIKHYLGGQQPTLTVKSA